MSGHLKGEILLAFCTLCGKTLPESGVCSCTAAPPPPPTVAPPHAQQYTTAPGYPQQPGQQPQVVYVVKQPSAIGADFNAAFGGFFSNTQNAVNTAAQKNSHMWLIFASAYAVFNGLFAMIVKSYWSTNADVGALFIGMLMGFIGFFSLFAVAMITLSAVGAKINPIGVLNALGVAHIFAIIMMFLAFLFKFFAPGMSSVFNIIGWASVLVLLYGLILAKQTKKAPAFLIFAGGVLACIFFVGAASMLYGVTTNYSSVPYFNATTFNWSMPMLMSMY